MREPQAKSVYHRPKARPLEPKLLPDIARSTKDVLSLIGSLSPVKVAGSIIVPSCSDRKEASATSFYVCWQKNSPGRSLLLDGAWHVSELSLQDQTKT